MHGVSIVIVLHNNIDLTKCCVKSILDSAGEVPYELILIDNGSTDETGEWLKSLDDERITVIEYPENGNLAARWNEGVRQAKYKYTMVLNNDTAITADNWLDSLLQIYKRADAVGLIVPCVTQALYKVNVRDRLGNRIMRLPKWGDMPSGVCYLFDKSAWEDVGGFAEDFGTNLGGEDSDFCARLWSKGYDIYIHEGVLINHVGGATSNQLENKAEIWKHNGEEFHRRWDLWFRRGSDPKILQMQGAVVSEQNGAPVGPLCIEGRVPRILIALPHIGTVSAHLAEWLLSHDHCGYETKILFSRERPISFNRKKIRQIFLESGMDWLLQIDSDMAPPKDLLKMVENQKDVCSAGIRTVKGSEIMPLAMKKIGLQEYAVHIGEGLFQCDAVGTGCLLTSRRSMEVIDYNHVADDIPAIDFDWCNRARAAGFEVWYDSRFRTLQFTVAPI